jgi:hypothetical protein
MELLRLLASLVRRDGTIFIIEEIFGDSRDEDEAFEWAADLAARRRLMANAEQVALALEGWGDPRADLVRQLRTNPGAVRELRASTRRFEERNRLPLSTWFRAAEAAGLHVKATAHPETPGLYLFSMARARTEAS